jgi:acetyl-CoA acetyltransferase
MSKALKDLRPVYVIGVGWHRYQFLSNTTYIDLGLTAVRQALKDAGLAWPAVESAYVGRAILPMACGRPILRHLGASGIPIVHVENASASGSTAFRHACIEVASGIADVSLALGVDKPMAIARSEGLTGIGNLADDAIAPFTHFAMLCDQYASTFGVNQEDIALVAVKNHRNGSKNPNAQHQKLRTLEEILGGKKISGTLTSLQCTPVGEGAAAAIVISEEGLKRYDLDRSRAVRVVASVGRSQRVYDDAPRYDSLLTRETAQLAFEESGIAPTDLDVVELHDAFTIEELEYLEAMGICSEGSAVPLLKKGEFDVGGRVAVSPSGGLIAMGHPIGPTGLGQIGEIVLQLRGDAGARQQPNARLGLAHMVGVGAVCYVTLLEKP